MNRMRGPSVVVRVLLIVVPALSLLFGGAASAMQPADILTLKSVSIADLDSTGTRLLYTVRAWNAESERRETTIYLRDLTDNEDLMLLAPADGARGAVWRPDGRAIAYIKQSPEGGQVWAMAPDGGDRHPLSPRYASFGNLHWAPDGSALAWISSTPVMDYGDNPDRWVVADDLGYRHLGEGYREGRLRQLFILDLTDDTITRVPADSLDVRSVAWSPDGSQLVLAAKARRNLNRNLNIDLWLASRTGRLLRRLTTNPGADQEPVWLADGRIAYLRATDPLWESAPCAVAVIEPAHGDAGTLQLHGTGFGNVIRGFITDGERFLVLGARHGCLDLVEVYGNQQRVLTDGGHDFWSVRMAGSRVVLAGAGQTLPGAIFTVDLAEKIKGPHHPRVLIDPNQGWRQRVGLVDPEPFSVTVEGRTIEGWCFKPPDMHPGQRVPTVLSIHGGPEWMYGGYFLPEFHILPHYGYAVIIANPTGSTGYGFEFQNGVRGDWVERPGRELLACVDWAIAEGWADPEALAVMGGSYGGHLAADLTTRTTRFKAAAVDRMFPDLAAFWGTTDEKWFPEWEFFGRPWEPKARQVYRRNSPTTRVDRVRTPTLISQGLQDYRCLIAGGEIWFSSLQALGVPSRFIRFTHEGHGIRDPRDQVFYQRQLLAFFDRYVLGLYDDEREAPADSTVGDEPPRQE